ncbi:hypothetical protein M5K25_013060 [Dendrobium thyrsiflorum]|uniref:DUF4743 domain-containing protein n=1 Tax=Dendrobium thyrsiflorum TaxID=117978 RepID=A0ABD0V5Y0_DENTH
MMAENLSSFLRQRTATLPFSPLHAQAGSKPAHFHPRRCTSSRPEEGQAHVQAFASAMAYRYFPTVVATLRSYPLTCPRVGIQSVKPPKSVRRSMVTGIRALMSVSGFGWHDALRAAERDDDDLSDLRGYFQRVRTCNRGSELQTQFVPFLVEDEVVGYIHEGMCCLCTDVYGMKSFINHLIKFQDVFTFMLDKDSCAVGAHVKLHSSLKTPEDRTSAVGDIIKCLGDLIPGIRNEMMTENATAPRPSVFSRLSVAPAVVPPAKRKTFKPRPKPTTAD